MTAIKDAMKKAGFDTASAELRALALEALRHHKGDIAKAAPKLAATLRKRGDLLEAVARDVLLQAQATGAPPVKVSGSTIPEHDRRAHRRQLPRSTEDKAAALRVAGEHVEALRSVFDRRLTDGRSIGELAWGELRRMVHDNAMDAASHLRLGTYAAENVIILDKIEAHASVDDHTTKVREIIPEAQLHQFIEDARIEAPRLIELGMHRFARTLEDRRSAQVTQQ